MTCQYSLATEFWLMSRKGPDFVTVLSVSDAWRHDESKRTGKPQRFGVQPAVLPALIPRIDNRPSLSEMDGSRVVWVVVTHHG